MFRLYKAPAISPMVWLSLDATASAIAREPEHVPDEERRFIAPGSFSEL
jgi:hypothetical protein